MGRHITVATLNLKKGDLRWGERAPLLMDELVRLRPDVVGFQEVDLRLDQGNWLCRRFNDLIYGGTGPGEHDPMYEIHHMANLRDNVALEALAIMTGLAVSRHEGMAYLIRNRVAHRITIDAGGSPVDFYNTHFHHELDAQGDEWRRLQAERLLEWMDRDGRNAPKVLVGDFNSPPGTGPIRILGERLVSAHALVHGREPHHTLTPMASILQGQEPPEGLVVDYIFVTPNVKALQAGVFCDAPDPPDPTLYPSDHLGVYATIELD